MGEHNLQSSIRNALAGELLLWRVNVGQAWTGDVQRLPGGAILIKNPRPFNTGLPRGFSDLFGIQCVTITPDMVGQEVGVFVALEVKHEAQPSAWQAAFLQAVRLAGGRSGVVRSVADARKVINASND